MFAIEVTGTNSLFGSLWKGLLCACTCAIIFELSRGLTGGVAFQAVYNFEFAPKPYGVPELLTFVGIGIVCGLLGAFFVFAYERFVRFRLRYKILRQSRIGLVTVVATLSALALYPSYMIYFVRREFTRGRWRKYFDDYPLYLWSLWKTSTI
jgi:H+/Cl- antiporter ClcA